MRILWAITGAVFACTISTVSTSQTSSVVTSVTASIPAAPASDDYKLGVGDRLRITVFNEDTLSGEFQVGANGRLSLPLVGDMDAAGLTTREVAVAFQSSLANGYLRDPHVSAEVIAYRPFYILGEVHNPAQYPYANNMTVYNAVATAGGFTPRASRKKVYIRHLGETGEKAYNLSPDLRVLPGDSVRVGERYF